ncbi:MAG: hypothetical protein ACKO0Z_07615 [Betaproteobacteria bacterium]
MEDERNISVGKTVIETNNAGEQSVVTAVASGSNASEILAAGIFLDSAAQPATKEPESDDYNVTGAYNGLNVIGDVSPEAVTAENSGTAPVELVTTDGSMDSEMATTENPRGETPEIVNCDEFGTPYGGEDAWEKMDEDYESGSAPLVNGAYQIAIAPTASITGDPNGDRRYNTREIIQVLEEERYNDGLRTQAVPYLAILDKPTYGLISMSTLPETDATIFATVSANMRLSKEQLDGYASAVDEYIKLVDEKTTESQKSDMLIIAMCTSGEGFYAEYSHDLGAWVPQPAPSVLCN